MTEFEESEILRVADVLSKTCIMKLPALIAVFGAKGYTIEDLKQEICIFCLDGINRYDAGRGNLFTFLFIHSRNRLLNLYRKIVKIPSHDNVMEYENSLKFEIDDISVDYTYDDNLKHLPIRPDSESPNKEKRHISLKNYAAQNDRKDILRASNGVGLPKGRKTNLKKKIKFFDDTETNSNE